MGQNRIGMIGVGLMGHGIALNVIAGGYQLAYLEHSGNQPTDDLVGATSYNSIAALAANADTIILCVTGSQQVHAIVTGEGGLLEQCAPGMTIIDCSTALPHETKIMADAILATGAAFLDAPMTRTPKEAAEGRLNLLIGGAPTTLAAQTPLLSCFAENITHVGPNPGDGHAAKLLHNFVSLGFAALLGEAFGAAHKAGLDAQALLSVLDSAGGKSVALERITPYIEAKNTDAMRFSIANAAKDTGYYTDYANTLGASDAIARAIAGVYATHTQRGHGDRFVPELLELLS